MYENSIEERVLENGSIEYQNVDLITLPLKTVDTSYVIIQNAIAQAYFDLDNTSQKLMLMALSVGNKLGSKQEIFGQSFSGVQFYITDFLKSAGLTDGGQTRESVRKCIKNLVSFQLTFTHESDGQVVEETTISMFQAASYNERSNSITLAFSQPLAAFLKDKPGYNILPFRDTKKLSSKYSLRWYSLFNSFAYLAGKSSNERSRFWKLFTFEQIRRMFKLENKYADVNLFKKRIIEEPIKEINEQKVNLRIAFEYIKDRKRINSVKFEIELCNNVWNFDDIGLVLEILGPSLGFDTKKILIDNKEEYLELAKLRNKFRTVKIDFNNYEDSKSKNEIKTFFLEVFTDLMNQLDQDKELIKRLNN